MEALIKQCKDNIHKAQETMKVYVDEKRRHVEFEKDECVFLKVPKSRYASLKGGHNKLAHRFYGPYRIVKRLGILLIN